MTAWCRGIGAGVVLIWLAGCGGSEEEVSGAPDDPAPVAETTQAPSAPAPTEKVAPSRSR